MLHLGVDYLFVAVEGEVVALGRDVGFGDAEALGGAEAVALQGGALLPAGQHVGQVVSGVLVRRERGGGGWTEFVLGEERGAFIVQAPAVGGAVIEPHLVGAA